MVSKDSCFLISFTQFTLTAGFNRKYQDYPYPAQFPWIPPFPVDHKEGGIVSPYPKGKEEYKVYEILLEVEVDNAQDDLYTLEEWNTEKLNFWLLCFWLCQPFDEMKKQFFVRMKKFARNHRWKE